jgi:hypothetical protein
MWQLQAWSRSDRHGQAHWQAQLTVALSVEVGSLPKSLAPSHGGATASAQTNLKRGACTPHLPGPGPASVLRIGTKAGRALAG